MRIAQKCQGLLHAIVIVAGFLSRIDKKNLEWEKVVGSLSSHIASDPEQCINTLELQLLALLLEIMLSLFWSIPRRL